MANAGLDLVDRPLGVVAEIRHRVAPLRELLRAQPAIARRKGGVPLHHPRAGGESTKQVPQSRRQGVLAVERSIEREEGRKPEVELAVESRVGESVDARGQVHLVPVEPRPQVVAAVRAARPHPVRPRLLRHASIRIAAEPMVVQAQSPVVDREAYRRAGMAQPSRESRQETVPEDGRPGGDHRPGRASGPGSRAKGTRPRPVRRSRHRGKSAGFGIIPGRLQAWLR